MPNSNPDRLEECGDLDDRLADLQYACEGLGSVIKSAVADGEPLARIEALRAELAEVEARLADVLEAMEADW